MENYPELRLRNIETFVLDWPGNPRRYLIRREISPLEDFIGDGYVPMNGLVLADILEILHRFKVEGSGSDKETVDAIVSNPFFEQEGWLLHTGTRALHKGNGYYEVMHEQHHEDTIVRGPLFVPEYLHVPSSHLAYELAPRRRKIPRVTSELIRRGVHPPEGIPFVDALLGADRSVAGAGHQVLTGKRGKIARRYPAVIVKLPTSRGEEPGQVYNLVMDPDGFALRSKLASSNGKPMWGVQYIPK